MTSITTELLDALLSPDATRRGNAEAYFQCLPLNEKVTGLVQQISMQSSSARSNDTPHLISLAAVLLRRDILRMSDYQAAMQMVDPLLESFLVPSGPLTTRIATGHCLAEICGSVALLSPSPQEKEQVMARILGVISNLVRL
jgi:hypothetical protein